MRTVAEIQADITSAKSKKNTNSTNAASYLNRVQELTNKRDDLQAQLDTLYTTYDEADDLCSNQALNLILSLSSPNECGDQFMQYAIDKVGEYRTNTLSTISRMTSRLSHQISKYNTEINDAQSLANAASINAGNADIELEDLYRELELAESAIGQ